MGRTHRIFSFRTVISLAWIGALTAGAGPVFAERVSAEPGQQTPPALVEDILRRDRHYDELESLSPDGRYFVIPVERYFSATLSGPQTESRAGAPAPGTADRPDHPHH